MANDTKSSEECLKAVSIMLEELKNAKRSLISSESCLVNRNLMQAQLEYLRDHLPETVKMAAAIVREEEKIRTETEQKKNGEDLTTDARFKYNDWLRLNSYNKILKTTTSLNLGSTTMFKLTPNQATSGNTFRFFINSSGSSASKNLEINIIKL